MSKSCNNSTTTAASLESLFNEITNESLRERLKSALKAHTDALIEQLDTAQHIRATLEDRLSARTIQYNKAVREVRYFREKYQHMAARYHERELLKLYNNEDSSIAPMDSFYSAEEDTSLLRSRDGIRMYERAEEGDHPSCKPSPWEYTTASSSHTSPYSSERSSTTSKPGLSYNNTEMKRALSDDRIDLLDVMAAVTENAHMLTLTTPEPMPPPQHPPPPPPPPLLESPVSPSSPAENNQPQDTKKQKDTPSTESAAATIKTRTMDLTYACGDGFWDTIARGKNKKNEVDTLISNYLRRGGQPNVAKNSASLKSVKEGYGLLHALVAVKNSQAVSRVIEAGANPNIVALGPNEEDKTTPLVLAAQLGYMRGVRLLYERANADLFQRGPRQMTALHAAVSNDSLDIVVYLLRASRLTLLDSVDVDGATPLHYACMLGRTRMMLIFLRDCQAKPDPRDHKGETPLHYAVRRRQYKAVCKLVGDLGVYPNPYVPKQTPTPLDLARSGGFKSISEYLRKMGAKTSKEMDKTAKRSSSANNSNHTTTSSTATTTTTSSNNSSSISSSASTFATSSTIGAPSIVSSAESISVYSSSDGSSIGSFLSPKLSTTLRSFNL